MPDAMMFNERKSTLCVTPNRRGIKLNRADNDRSYKIVNRLKVVNTSCKKGYSWQKLQLKQIQIKLNNIFNVENLSKEDVGTRKIWQVIKVIGSIGGISIYGS